MKTEARQARVYLDTSAYLSILLKDPMSRPLRARLRGKIICVSSLLVIEAERNLVRLFRQGDLTEAEWNRAQNQFRDDIESFIIRDWTFDLCLTGQFPAIRTPRSGDLAHLRTALWFAGQGGLDAFLTLDIRQEAAAREMGLPI